jgi:hypothetical protein
MASDVLLNVQMAPRQIECQPRAQTRVTVPAEVEVVDSAGATATAAAADAAAAVPIFRNACVSAWPACRPKNASK